MEKNFEVQGRKKSKGGPFGLVWYCMLRGKILLVQFPGSAGEIQNFVELLVQLFWSLQVFLKNTDEKP